MNALGTERNCRILVIDDNQAIHADFRKILCPPEQSGADFQAQEAAFFGEAVPVARRTYFEIDSAFQGADGLVLVEKAVKLRRPYALAFVDVRMPPGWDGIETTGRLW